MVPEIPGKGTPLFALVEGAQAVISEKGLYKQADVFVLGEDLFAVYSRGFVRLLQKNTTSRPHVKWHRVVGCEYRIEWDGVRLTDGTIAAQAAE